MRSRTGCLTCRQRKLKCDEAKPVCGQCTKASRECVPCSGVVFRHQHNASMNGAPAGEGLEGFYAYKNTFDKSSIWVDIPKAVTFIHTTNPYEDPLSPLDHPLAMAHEQNAAWNPYATPEWPFGGDSGQWTGSPSTQGLQALSAVAAGDHLAYPSAHVTAEDAVAGLDAPHHPPGDHAEGAGTPPTPNLSSRHPMSPPQMSMTSSSHNINFLLNPSIGASPPIDPSLQSPLDRNGKRPTTASSQTASTSPTSHPHDPTFAVNEHELGFLLRCFAEGPGIWMDLFDLGLYFSAYVPVKAGANPILMSSAVACAAKALGRVRGKRPTYGGSASHQARMELYPSADRVDWYRKAAEYYDSAVSQLRQALQETQHHSPAASDVTLQAASPTAIRHPEDPTTVQQFPKSNTDELLAATAILCVYEFLDASGPEWSRHLDGAKSLIDLAKDSMMPLQLPSPGMPLQHRVPLTKARRATFWNIARQDMLAAFINQTHTRLDPEDEQMWRDAGLLIDEDGFVQPSNLTSSGYPEGEGVMREDMISNALIWLMAKLVNFMASEDKMPPQVGPSWQAIPQRTLLDYWHYLKKHFRIWYEGLPLTFRPCAKVDPTSIPRQLVEEECDTLFPETWYSIPMCASTMQSFHMAQVQLNINKPHESTQGASTVFDRFHSYKATLADSEAHSREIVRIALSRPEAGVRIHSVQPLFTAGQCLGDPNERRVILKLLREIEADTGWATDYRVDQLLQHWQWTSTEETVGS